MTLYLIGTDVFADTTHELAAAALRLGGLQAVAAGTSAERLEVTSRQARVMIEWSDVQVLPPGQGALLLEARRHGVPLTLDQLRQDPAAVAMRIADAAAKTAIPSDWTPSRVQLSRRSGYRLPPRTVSVAAPSRYANPYRPARRTPEANREAVELFRGYLQRNPLLVDQARAELTGLNLACWCRPELACHADVWLELVNSSTRIGEDLHGDHQARRVPLMEWVDRQAEGDASKYRYTLRRDLGLNPRRVANEPALLWIMLNPSTADDTTDDPTIRRVIDFTNRLGYRQLTVVNLYARRATDPKDLWRSDDPIGASNDATIREEAGRDVLSGSPIVAAWGVHAKPERVAQVVNIPHVASRLHCLGVTKSGAPRHPLYLPRTATLLPWPIL